MKLIVTGVWNVLQLLMPWWFGTPSSQCPYRSRHPCPDTRPLPKKKPKAARPA